MLSETVQPEHSASSVSGLAEWAQDSVNWWRKRQRDAAPSERPKTNYRRKVWQRLVATENMLMMVLGAGWAYFLPRSGGPDYIHRYQELAILKYLGQRA